MSLTEELLISKTPGPGQELALAILFTGEVLGRLMEERIFRPQGLTEQQFNVLRIVKGGPPEGWLIRDIRRRMIFRNADVPRLVDRMVRLGLVACAPDPADRRGRRVRLTARGEALEARMRPLHESLCQTIGGHLDPGDRQALVGALERLRAAFREDLESQG
jgi:DNA-binding MarR family transcriptional regulator